MAKVGEAVTGEETPMRFENKVVVITGGASGIGAAAAKRFHSEGAKLVIADVNDTLGEELASSLGEDRCVYQHTDVSLYSEVEALITAAVERFGRIDVLFNNAGIGSVGRTPDLTIEDWSRVIAVDLNSVFFGCKAAIPVMRDQGAGVIINTASISGIAGDHAFAAYNAAKGGVINFTRAAAIDHAREGIRINAVCPGPVATPLIEGVSAIPGAKETWDDLIPMGRFAEPEEIASVAAFLASDDAAFMTGAAVVVDGGLTAHTGQPNLLAIVAKNQT